MAKTMFCDVGRPNTRSRVMLGIVALAIVTVGRAGAQEVDRDTGAGVTFPGATAEPITGAPTIDGQVLDDPVWTAIEPVTGFTQTTPNEGQPASERTEVRIAYSADTLYFGVVCYDGDPSTIIVSDSRRDSPLSETDSFLIILDTYRDQQNGFVFGTNPSGLEYDGQVTNEGQGTGGFVGGGRGGGGGRQQRGTGRGFNLNWDGSWEVRTQVSDIGWSAEFAVPFRTLRYSSGESQTWGLNFQRNIRRRNETAFWSALPRQYTLYRLSLAGQLTGLQLPPQRNLKIMPYVLGDAVSNEFDGNDVLLGDTGIDLKYSLTPSLTLDATYNTDFAQVEVDDQQVNLNRFNLFFPEKRPFFLENAGLFGVGNTGSAELFFSRRIGIGPDGQVIPILGGGRLSGQVGGNLNVGLLSMQTQEVEGVAPSNNFTVARVRKDLRNRSNVGAIFVSRQASGDLAGTDVLSDPTIRIVDTRNTGYEESHIPGAVPLDISTSRDASNPPTFLPSLEAFIEVIEAIGIGNDTRVIFYDDRGGVYGTRPWLVLRALGYTQAAILDGGWDAWMREGRPTTSEVTEVARARFEPRPDDAWIVTAEDVRDAIDRPGTRIVDTRTVDELEGRDLRGAKRGGIVPSAIAIYWEETLDSELKTFKPAHELRALFASHGLDPEDEIITYCEGGGRSAHELFVLHLVGYDRVRLYVGSWDEWGNRDDLPLATW